MRKILAAALAVCFALLSVPAMAQTAPSGRSIVYPLENQPSVDSVLQPARFTRLALGSWMLHALNLTGSGSGVYANCTTSPSTGFYVTIAPTLASSLCGLYQVAQDDAAPIPIGYTPNLSPDATLIVVQALQGATSSNIGPLTPPATSGQSVYYLVEAQIVTTDQVPSSRPFLNPTSGVVSRPTVNTQRVDAISYQLKAGTAGTSPTQPTADSGWIPVSYVLVPNGATSITMGMISAGALWTGFPVAGSVVQLQSSPTPTQQPGGIGVGGFVVAGNIMDTALTPPGNICAGTSGLLKTSGCANGTVTSVTGSGNLAVSAGPTPNVTITAAPNFAGTVTANQFNSTALGANTCLGADGSKNIESGSNCIQSITGAGNVTVSAGPTPIVTVPTPSPLAAGNASWSGSWPYTLTVPTPSPVAGSNVNVSGSWPYTISAVTPTPAPTSSPAASGPIVVGGVYPYSVSCTPTGFACATVYQASAYGVAANGSDQTSNLQAAATAVCGAVGTGYGTLQLPPGTITQNSQVLVPCSHVTPAGYGGGFQNFPGFGSGISGTTVIKYGGTGAYSSPLWLFDGNQNATPAEQGRNGMRDLMLDGNHLAAIGIKVTGNSDGRYENLQIQNFTQYQMELSGETLTGAGTCSSNPNVNTCKGDAINNVIDQVSMYAPDTGAGCLELNGNALSTAGASDADVNRIQNDQCVSNGDGFDFHSSDSNIFINDHLQSTGSSPGYNVHFNCGSHGNRWYSPSATTFRAEGTGVCGSGGGTYQSASIDTIYDFPISTFGSATISMDTGAGLTVYTDRGDILPIGESGNQSTPQQIAWGNYNGVNLRAASGAPAITVDSAYSKLYLGCQGTSQNCPVYFWTAGMQQSAASAYIDSTGTYNGGSVILSSSGNDITFPTSANGGSIVNQSTSQGVTLQNSAQTSGNALTIETGTGPPTTIWNLNYLGVQTLYNNLVFNGSGGTVINNTSATTSVGTTINNANQASGNALQVQVGGSGNPVFNVNYLGAVTDYNNLVFNNGSGATINYSNSSGTAGLSFLANNVSGIPFNFNYTGGDTSNPFQIQVGGSNLFWGTSAGVWNATQFNGSGAGLTTGTIPDAALVTAPLTGLTGSGNVSVSGCPSACVASTVSAPTFSGTITDSSSSPFSCSSTSGCLIASSSNAAAGFNLRANGTPTTYLAVVQNSTPTTEFSIDTSGNTVAQGSSTASQFNGSGAGITSATLPNAALSHTPTGYVTFATLGTGASVALSGTGGTYATYACGTNSSGCSSGTVSIVMPTPTDGPNTKYRVRAYFAVWLSAVQTSQNVSGCVSMTGTFTKVSGDTYAAGNCETALSGSQFGTTAFAESGNAFNNVKATAEAEFTAAAGATITFTPEVVSSGTATATTFATLYVEASAE